MQITFSPSRDDRRPVFERQGDVLLIDAEPFDFGPVPDGGCLPEAAVASEWICGDVTRTEGVLHLTLKLAHGAVAPETVRFPVPLLVTQDGPITPITQPEADQT